MGTINLKTDIPGPNSQALVARREAAMALGQAKLTQIAVARAMGTAVEDVDGNTLLDFAGGIGMLAVGHCPPDVVSALQAQAAESDPHVLHRRHLRVGGGGVRAAQPADAGGAFPKRVFSPTRAPRRWRRRSRWRGPTPGGEQSSSLKGRTTGVPT